MAVKIRLKRMGKIRQPHYRVVVVDSRKKRDGKVIEEIGKYHPKQEPSFIEVTSERALYWLGVGAQPSEAVQAILKITGDWQKFKGLPGTEGTLRTAEPKRDKAEIFNEALKDAANEPKSEAVTRKRAEKKTEKKADAPEKAEKTDGAGKSETAKTEAPAAGVAADAAPEGPADKPADEPADKPAAEQPSADKAEETPAEASAPAGEAAADADVAEAEKADAKPEA